jgi:hypothetical protein
MAWPFIENVAQQEFENSLFYQFLLNIEEIKDESKDNLSDSLDDYHWKEDMSTTRSPIFKSATVYLKTLKSLAVRLLKKQYSVSSSKNMEYIHYSCE